MLEAQDILSYLTLQQSHKECTAELFLSEPIHQKQMVSTLHERYPKQLGTVYTTIRNKHLEIKVSKFNLSSIKSTYFCSVCAPTKPHGLTTHAAEAQAKGFFKALKDSGLY